MDDNAFNQKITNEQFRKLQLYSIIFLIANELAFYIYYGRTDLRETIVFPIFLLILYVLKLVDFKMPKFKKTDVFYIIGGYLVTLALRIIMIMIQGEDATSVNQAGLESTFTLEGFKLVLVIFTMVIVAPIEEELLYRRLLIGNVFRKMPLLGVLVSALVFGGVHMFAGFDFGSFIDYALTGLVFGLIYYKTRRIEVSIAAHMLNNAFSAFLLLGSETFGWFNL